MDTTQLETQKLIGPGNTLRIPEYRSIGGIIALKITGVEVPKMPDRGITLSFEPGHDPIQVARGWYNRHRPTCNGYYVMYECGHAIYLPTNVFEKEYILVEKE